MVKMSGKFRRNKKVKKAKFELTQLGKRVCLDTEKKSKKERRK